MGTILVRRRVGVEGCTAVAWPVDEPSLRGVFGGAIGRQYLGIMAVDECWTELGWCERNEVREGLQKRRHAEA